MDGSSCIRYEINKLTHDETRRFSNKMGNLIQLTDINKSHTTET